MNSEQRMAEMKRRLEQALQPQHIEIIDEGHMHVGHEGARDGRGHFRLEISSSRFAGASMVQTHRLVYQAMGDLMQSDIHALTINARVPDTA